MTDTAWIPALAVLTTAILVAGIAAVFLRSRGSAVELRTSPQLRGFLWGVAFMALAFGLYTMVTHEQQPRAPMPTTAADDTELLKERLSKNPDDQEALAQLSHRLLRQMMIDEAQILNDRLLHLAPTHPEALAHKAMLRAAHGERDAAVADLTALLKAHPTFAEGWMFRGMLGMQSGDTKLMRESFAEYVKYAPDGPQKERIRAMLSQP